MLLIEFLNSFWEGVCKLDHLLNLRIAVAEAAQNFERVVALRVAGVPVLDRALGQVDGAAHLGDRLPVCERDWDRRPHSAASQMLVPGDLVEVHDGLHAGVEPGKNFGPLRAGLGAEDSGELSFDPKGIRAENLAVAPFGVADAVAQGGPELGLQGSDTHVAAVRRLVEIVDPAAIEQAALSRGNAPTGESAGAVHGIERDDAVLHGDVNVLTHSRALAVNDRCQNTDHRIHRTARHVRDLEVVEAGAAFLATGGSSDAGAGHVVDVVAGSHGERAVLAVAGDGTVDNPRIDRAQLLVGEAELLHDAGAELLDDDVVVHDQLADGLHGGRLLEVEMDGLLAAAEPGLGAGDLRAFDDRGPVDHQVVFVLAADLEHFRAEVSQRHRGVGPGKKCGEIEYFVSV